MKHAPLDQSLRERLDASRFSAEGFLGNDAREIEEIVAQDRAELERLGVTEQAVVQALRAADDQARATLGAPVRLAPGLVARHHEAMGKTPSPFRGDGVFAKGETEVLWDDGRRLRLTALGLALIERHGFFQGRGSLYRIEPQDAAALCRRLAEPSTI
jgi:hypothetical protein